MAAPDNHPPTFERSDRGTIPRAAASDDAGYGIGSQARVEKNGHPVRPLHVELGFSSIAEKRKVFDWLGRGLRPDRPGRLQQEYPQLFQNDASVFFLTLYEGSTPVAFCTLWAVHFRVGVDRLRAGLISFVYTDPDARGRGHAGLVVEHALEKARALKLGLALLWSDIDSLYTRLGFVQAGGESLVLVDRATLRAACESMRHTQDGEAVRIETPATADWKAIERLRGNRDCQLELDSGQIARMSCIPDMSVRVARKSESASSQEREEIVAFAIRGRGDDFEEVIHEWAGEPEAALRCCLSLIEDCQPHSELFLLTPPDDAEVPWRLRKAGARVIQQPLAWMRILSTTAFAEDLSRIMPDSTRIQIKEVPPTAGASVAAPKLIIKTTKGELTLDQPTLLALILGPGPRFFAEKSDQRLAELRNRRLASILDDAALEALPLPFFVWGMESI